MTHIDPEKLDEAIQHLAVEAETALDWIWVRRSQVAIAIDAARAHLATLPRFKEVEVWRVEWAYFDSPHVDQFKSEREAREYAGRIAGHNTSCVAVSPHKQRVPA